MQEYKLKILKDTIERSNGDWKNLSYLDKLNLIRLCKEYRKLLLEETLPQLDQICSVPEEYCEMEEVYRIFKEGIIKGDVFNANN